MTENLGSVRVSPSVLATIVSLTTVEVPGVARMGDDLVSGVNRLIGRPRPASGVKVQIKDGSVQVDLHVIVRSGFSLVEVGSQIQDTVAEAINRMVGMPVCEVNVFVQDVE
ncbi:MAG: Asp23/Gls24 family envelope stress response protein [Chloroflexota bacterium]